MEENQLRSDSAGWVRLRIVWRLSSVIAIVVAVAVTISVLSSGPTPVAAAPYDGVTVYRALFFASGPLASKIPTIQKASRYLPASYKGLEAQVIKYIQTNNPKFFDNFGREIQSGDRVRVAAAIRSVRPLQKEALLAITKNQKGQFSSDVARLRVENPPEAENDGNVAVEVLVFVVLFVTVFWESPKNGKMALQGLTFDRYVDEVVRAVPRSPQVKSAGL
jgi:SdpC family antimicrobial peptide